jgi:arylsulfatase A-like enzyme
VHYFDAHQPYQPPPPWDRAFDPGYRGPMDGDPRRFWMLHQQGRATRADVEHMVALYDGEISFLDAWIGRLFDGVRAAGRWDETLVVVVADHGEGFGEHGQLFEHNSEIFDEAMRVPLLIRRPEASARGERTDALARTIDVAPTIVEWLAIEPQAAMQGQSLLAFTAADPAARAAASGPEEVLLEALRERQVNPTPHSFVGLRGADWKLIVTYDEKSSIRKTEFFDLSVDPEEKHPLVDDTSDRAVRLQRRLFDAYWNLPRPARSNARELGALDSDALRALGYTDK